MKTENKVKKNALTTVSAGDLALVMHSPLGGTLEKPFTRHLLLMNSYVAGTNYIRLFRKYLKEVQKGDKVVLMREPDNAEDKFAIQVINDKKHKLGYIPRRKNKVVARLLDAGKHIYGVVDETVIPKRRNQNYWYLKINVFMED